MSIFWVDSMPLSGVTGRPMVLVDEVGVYLSAICAEKLRQYSVVTTGDMLVTNGFLVTTVSAINTRLRYLLLRSSEALSNTGALHVTA